MMKWRVGGVLLPDHSQRGHVVHREAGHEARTVRDIDSTVDCPATVRLRRITPEATRKRTCMWSVRGWSTYDELPVGVRISLLLNGVIGRTSVVGVCPTGVEGGGGVDTGEKLLRGRPASVENQQGVLRRISSSGTAVEISARPSAPTATPSGFAGSVTVCVTGPAFPDRSR